MDRGAILAYVIRHLGPILTTAGIVLTDTDDGLGPILDMVDEHFLNDPTLHPRWAAPLARYYALMNIRDRLLNRFDIASEGDNLSLNQLLKNVADAVKEAYVAVGWIVLPATPAIPDTDTPEPTEFVRFTSHFLNG